MSSQVYNSFMRISILVLAYSFFSRQLKIFLSVQKTMFEVNVDKEFLCAKFQMTDALLYIKFKKIDYGVLASICDLRVFVDVQKNLLEITRRTS